MSSRQSETNRWSVFDIPNKFEDLKYQISSASYYVPNVLDLAEFNTQLQSCARIREPNQILDYFPLFYSIAIEYGQVPSVSRHQAADALIRLTISEAAEVQRRLHLGLTGDERRLHLNIIKMLCCLLAEFTIRADSDNSQKVEELIPKTQKKGKKGDQSSDNFTNELLRDKCLKALGDVLRAHIRPLWEPSIIDEQFVKTVTKPCYNLLRKQDVHKNAVIKENFPLIIAIMVDKFGHARDSSAFKSMATFITQIAELDPKIIRTHIDLLLDLLTVDVHHIRIAVLIAFAHVIDRELVPVDSLDDSAKKLRDELFRCLSDHVYDSNSYVRTNALQIWAGLIQGKKVPVKQLIQAFEFGLCRLRDAACPVRKEAVTLVMHVILSNPYFGIDVTHADLEEQRIKTEKELEELQKIVNEKDKSDDDDVDENEIDEKSKDTKKLVRRDDDDDDQKKEDAEFIILSSDEENDDNIVNDSRTSNNISQNQSYEMKDVDDIKVKIEKESGENAINQSIHEDLERVQIQQEIDKKKELIAIYKVCLYLATY
ncbi:unnamed protein product [Didymodactylos carnosus]|uniref:Condensin complex subunit 1 N-terminal domain-containing protein n=1 Tax=Didymodactylos carnosus TaxID=1234261 RepID=A0A8S2FFW3_9BILA|nr:unnamed protein product [Didymodactylos carnosus]CAF4247109.1 unnamed protein product [Didymodactylos carnosus]